jgi:hypothetical protein
VLSCFLPPKVLPGRTIGAVQQRFRTEWSPRGLLAVGLALVLPPAVAVAWIPVRAHLPNVDLALLLVLATVSLGALGSRTVVVCGSLGAALWFEFFDTVPYEHLEIARNPDIETTAALALVGLVVGELAVRASRHRKFVRTERENLRSLRTTAELVASGEELVGVIGAVCADLAKLLSLRECVFEASAERHDRPQLSREGLLVLPARPLRHGPDEPDAPRCAEVPVIVQGERIGHFMLTFQPDRVPDRDAMLVAVTLADNVGAAFLAQAPPPPPPDREPALPLRLVTTGPEPRRRKATAAHNPGGVSSRAATGP